tara:strand:+ start:350 stop:631 length:282 start_codon:yes stop_codon:yes gene_type:complete
MRTLAFNTGRTYTAEGQRIAAGLLDNGDIVFNDIDRTICGTIAANGLTLDEVINFNCFTQAAVMADYDANRYTDGLAAEIRTQLQTLAQSLTN